MSAIAVPARRRSALPAAAWLGILSAAALVVAAIILWSRVQTVESVGQLTAVAGSPVRGTVSVVSDSDDRATLTLRVTGLTPGLEYPVHLHSGTPAQPGASPGVLGVLRAGAVGASVELTGTLLADGPRFVDVHAEGARDAIAVALLPVRSGR